MRRRPVLLFGVASLGFGAVRVTSAQPAPEGSVPFQLLRTGDIGGLVSIEVMLDGKPTRWLVDSGSSTALVSPALAERLRLRRLSPVRVATAGGVQTVDRFELPAIPLLGGVAKASGAVAIDLGSLFGPAGAAVDGLIGAPWLRNVATTFDFPRNQLRWARGAAAPPPGAVALPLRWDGALPVLRLALGNRGAEDFLFDTGNAGALVVFSQRAQALLADAGQLPEITVRELGGTVQARYARIERLGAPGLAWRDVPAALEAGATARRGGHFDRLAGSVGIALFEAGVVTLDGPGERLLVQLPGLPEPPPVPGGFGFSLSARGGSELAVSGVIDGSPASVAGIMAGDTLRAIDGVDARGWGAVDAWRLLASRETAAFDLARGETAPQRLRLERQRYFPLLR